MKKFIVLFLLTLYMGSTTGATFSMHYCEGRLVEVQMVDGEEDHCPKCGAKEALDCCKNEHKTLRLDEDQKPAGNASYLLPMAALALPVSFTVLPALSPVAAVTPGYPGHVPPDAGKVSPGILHCIFRI
jgi:hypothetical protein